MTKVPIIWVYTDQRYSKEGPGLSFETEKGFPYYFQYSELKGDRYLSLYFRLIWNHIIIPVTANINIPKAFKNG